ncbi:hypothetical protein JCM18909_3100 [Cutibacterium acnes JCM 18909]|nr:hypothetical protein JCM18909_3100 [Cutibacterium acnes JCM 18909]
MEASMINRPLAALSAMFIALTTGITLSQPAQASPTPPPDPALKQTVSDNEKVAKGPAEIKRGHVDIGPRIVDGKFSLMARDDSANPPVWRNTDDTVLRVADASRIDVPNDDTYSFLGDMRGEKAYVIPQTQDQKSRLAGLEHPSPRDRQKISRVEPISSSQDMKARDKLTCSLKTVSTPPCRCITPPSLASSWFIWSQYARSCQLGVL